DALAGEHEEVLLLGLPVVRRRRLAAAGHLDRHAEHREERLGFVLVAAGERQARSATGAVEPARVACVEDEPALARGDEAGAFVLELRLAHDAPDPTSPPVHHRSW